MESQLFRSPQENSLSVLGNRTNDTLSIEYLQLENILINPTVEFLCLIIHSQETPMDHRLWSINCDPLAMNHDLWTIAYGKCPILCRAGTLS